MPCCCINACWLREDNFNRAASTNLGGNWHEEVGDWEIIGDAIAGWLHELAATTPGTDGTSASVVMYTQPVPARSAGEMQVRVSIVDPVVGDVFRILLACTTYHGAGGEWVEFEYTGTDEWLVTLSTGESKTQTWTPIEPLDTTTPVVACIDSDGFLMGSIASSGDEFPWNDGDATATGRYAGLYHDNDTHGAVFDDFSIRELRTPTTECVSCFCHCGSLSDRNNIQKTLALTIFDAIDRASCLDTLSVSMTWEWNSGVPRWVSDVLTVGAAEFKWYVECGTHNPASPFAHFSLNWFPGYKTCCSGNPGGCDGVHLPDAGASTCDPLSLVFGPFVLSVGELTCTACSGSADNYGTYYIAVSEAP